MRLDAFDAAAANALLDEMSGEAHALVAPRRARRPTVRARGSPSCATSARATRSRSPLPDAAARGSRCATRCATAFERDYAALFARHIPNAAIEILSWSVLVSTEARAAGRRTAPAPTAPRRSRSASAPVFDAPQRPRRRRAGLPARRRWRPAQRFAGPGHHRRGRDLDLRRRRSFDAHIDAAGCIVLDRKDAMRRHANEPVQQRRPDRPADHVEPADRRGRGAGADAAAHRLPPDRARGGDLSAGVFDLKGRMLAQAVTGTPGHVNSMAESVKHFIAPLPGSRP